MDDYLEVPSMDARNWLADAARECGYPSENADAIGYIAWWLENRGAGGVLRTTVYLLGIHGRPYDELKPEIRDDTVVGICPVEFVTPILVSLMKGENDLSEWTGGMATADPVLIGPLLAQMLEYKYNIHIKYHDQHVIFCQDGIAILSDSLATFAMTNTKSGVDLAIRLVKSGDEDVPLTFRYQKKETLRIPGIRYLEGGGFRFDPS